MPSYFFKFKNWFFVLCPFCVCMCVGICVVYVLCICMLCLWCIVCVLCMCLDMCGVCICICVHFSYVCCMYVWYAYYSDILFAF